VRINVLQLRLKARSHSEKLSAPPHLSDGMRGEYGADKRGTPFPGSLMQRIAYGGIDCQLATGAHPSLTAPGPDARLFPLAAESGRRGPDRRNILQTATIESWRINRHRRNFRPARAVPVDREADAS
jgi:hypothetical protein